MVSAAIRKSETTDSVVSLFSVKRPSVAEATSAGVGQSLPPPGALSVASTDTPRPMLSRQPTARLTPALAFAQISVRKADANESPVRRASPSAAAETTLSPHEMSHDPGRARARIAARVIPSGTRLKRYSAMRPSQS